MARDLIFLEQSMIELKPLVILGSNITDLSF